MMCFDDDDESEEEYQTRIENEIHEREENERIGREEAEMQEHQDMVREMQAQEEFGAGLDEPEDTLDPEDQEAFDHAMEKDD